MTADVSCPRCGQGWWVTRPDVVPFVCPDCPPLAAEQAEYAAAADNDGTLFPDDSPLPAMWLLVAFVCGFVAFGFLALVALELLADAGLS